MSMTAEPPEKLWTLDEFLALPDDGVERWLIRGRLRTRGDTRVTQRNKYHSYVVNQIGHLIREWLDGQPKPRGAAFAGEVGVILRHDPLSSAGIDVAYFSAAVRWRDDRTITLIDAIPTLAVEVLSPGNTMEEIDEKLSEYLDVGVPLTWIVNPYRETVTVYRPGEPPVMFNVQGVLTADPHLPGFSVPVARVFED